MQSRIVGRQIPQCPAIEGHIGAFGGKIVGHVGLVVANAVGPAKIARRPRLIPLVQTDRPPLRIGLAGVGADIAPVEPAALAVDRQPERIAHAHDVNLGPSFFGLGKQIPRGNTVATIVLRFDAQDLAAQIGTVGRRALGVPIAPVPAARPTD